MPLHNKSWEKRKYTYKKALLKFNYKTVISVVFKHFSVCITQKYVHTDTIWSISETSDDISNVSTATYRIFYTSYYYYILQMMFTSQNALIDPIY